MMEKRLLKIKELKEQDDEFQLVCEYQDSADAESRLQQAFEMLFKDVLVDVGEDDVIFGLRYKS